LFRLSLGVAGGLGQDPDGTEHTEE
jgi:hypothetical protein